MFNGTSFHNVESVNNKNCIVCSKEFKPKSGVNKFCSSSCKGKWKYITGVASTENQYKKISNNWRRYLSRLIYSGGRKRYDLKTVTLLKILERQNYKCALSGEDLTCVLTKGYKQSTNASVDRIVPGGPYTEDNIQLVCRALNSWRGDLSIKDYTRWCKKVVDHQTKKKVEVRDGQA